MVWISTSDKSSDCVLLGASICGGQIDGGEATAPTVAEAEIGGGSSDIGLAVQLEITSPSNVIANTRTVNLNMYFAFAHKRGQ